MNLEKIVGKYGIKIKNSDGALRNVVDVLEDMYLKMTPTEFNRMTFEMQEEELQDDIFNKARGRRYKEAR